MVVRLSEGKDAIQAYVDKEVAQGLPHVLDVVTADNNRVLALIGDLTEDEATTVTPVDEWRVFDVMKHLSASLDRSRTRLETLSSGRPFVPPPGVSPGSMGAADYASFSDLRLAYVNGMADILAVLRHADSDRGLELTADHATFGTYNWLGWAIYSHHVHTHDHIGQIENIKNALRDG
jgi:DinB superfamily